MSAPVVDQLIQLAHQFGSDVTFIQGGGGNISLKTNSTELLIKASGTILRDMSPDHGYVGIDRQTGQVVGSSARPSMELPLHLALTSKCVIHTHSVYANILNCLVGGIDILQEILSAWQPWYIPYVHPGQALGEVIQAGPTPDRSVILLENHGVITYHDDPIEAARLMTMVHTTVLAYLQAHWPQFKPFQVLPADQLISPAGSVFPDAAVFTGTTISPARLEILSANQYIIQTIEQGNGTVRYLTDTQMSDLRSMESEQYRIKLTV